MNDKWKYPSNSMSPLEVEQTCMNYKIASNKTQPVFNMVIMVFVNRPGWGTLARHRAASFCHSMTAQFHPNFPYFKSVRQKRKNKRTKKNHRTLGKGQYLSDQSFQSSCFHFEFVCNSMHPTNNVANLTFSYTSTFKTAFAWRQPVTDLKTNLNKINIFE